MKASDACFALIEKFEGLRLVVGTDTNGVPTVGYGHDDTSMVVGTSITPEQAEAFLQTDVANTESFLNRVISHPLTQNQFDALCDFVYNVGSGVFYKSKLLGFINDGLTRAAADDLLRFSYDSNKNFLPGLFERRKAERELFLT